MSDEAAHAAPIIEVIGLSKQYRGAAAAALDGVDLELHRGEVLALLGPNGAGKTTLVETLAGVRTRDAGSVRVLGLDPGKRSDQRALRSRLGLVLQHTAHYRFLTVRETLAMHAAVHVRPRPVEEVLELVGLTEVSNRRVRQLSGGQQRRLDVGVAIVGRPELIFLDEPTTGFDPAARQRAWELVDSLARLGTSIVLTSHYMEEVQRLADRVVLLLEGRVHAQGTPASLASQLVGGSVVRCSLPQDVAADDLPGIVRHGWRRGTLELRVEHPAAVLAELGSWAVGRGLGLDDLVVEAPRLEDAFLALTNVTEVQAPA